MGTEKIVGRGKQKIVTGWGVRISPQGGGLFEEQGGGREGELSKKIARKQLFCEKKFTIFLRCKKRNTNFLENV